MSPAVVELQPFLRSPKYGDQARDDAVNILSTSSDSAFFSSLFGPALTPVTWTNLDRVVRLDRALLARGYPLWNKSWDPKTQNNDLRRLTKEERATFDYIEAAVPLISSEVGSVLKTPQPRGTSVDLSATYFKNADWSGINFKGVNLKNIDLNSLDLKNAQLTGVTEFTGAQFDYVAWWEARSIDRRLLEYLQRAYPFRPRAVYGYGPSNEVATQSDYDTSVGRLMSQSK
ncbi:MAG: pentapeptide repeat-containing protein [Acidobacteriaceae bacterium]|nr:pentapeptide repeat-containing protein [Acidobacteriota bacterium]MBV9498506.1 pentapeptide repeat-containing protein [Acidobacteriaceae bacterium]